MHAQVGDEQRLDEQPAQRGRPHAVLGQQARHAVAAHELCEEEAVHALERRVARVQLRERRVCVFLPGVSERALC